MSTFKRLKDKEKSAARVIVSVLRRGFQATVHGLAGLVKLGRQKLTIMLVPHSEKRILNIQISIFGLAGIFIVLIGATVFLSWSALNYSSVAAKLAGKTSNLQETRDDLDLTRDHVNRLINAARQFQASLDSTFNNLGLSSSSPQADSGSGDLAGFFELDQSGAGNLRELSELDRVTAWLEQSVRPLAELETILSSQGDILTEIPNIWPIRAGLGHITMYYGQNENPIFGSWYMHKGIDISTFRSGDPIVTTADGKVVDVAYDNGLGNHVIVEHKYGFITRYAHLSAFNVQKGDIVRQGQVIGFIGNTGLSTGAHLHYEVHLGTATIDPLRFINSRPNQTAGLNN